MNAYIYFNIFDYQILSNIFCLNMIYKDITLIQHKNKNNYKNFIKSETFD